MQVYIVDDEEIFLEYAASAISETVGIPIQDICCFADPLAGLCETLKNRPDVILVDLMMPHMDGAKFARHVKLEVSDKWRPIMALVSAKLDDAYDDFDYLVGKPLTPARAQALFESIKKFSPNRDEDLRSYLKKRLKHPEKVEQFVDLIKIYTVKTRGFTREIPFSDVLHTYAARKLGSAESLSKEIRRELEDGIREQGHIWEGPKRVICRLAKQYEIEGYYVESDPIFIKTPK